MIIQQVLYCAYFRDNYKLIAIDLSKPQALDADSRAVQQVKFTTNVDRAGNTRNIFILKKPKETVLDFSQQSIKSL